MGYLGCLLARCFAKLAEYNMKNLMSNCLCCSVHHMLCLDFYTGVLVGFLLHRAPPPEHHKCNYSKGKKEGQLH